MKVILLSDVPKIGKKYEIKNIPDGHVRNFLLPKGLVQVANPKTIKQMESKKIEMDRKNKEEEKSIKEALQKLKNTTIIMKGKINDQGHLFAGIHNEEIISQIKKQIQLNINVDNIKLEKPIKEIGEHQIQVEFQDINIKFKLLIEEDKN